VASFLTVTGSDDCEPFVYVTTQVRDQPAVSPVTVLVSHEAVCITPTGSHANATVMLVLYQSVEQPPPLHDTVIGAALAAGTIVSKDRLTAINVIGYRQLITSAPDD
jgi:hypothetical protein